MWMPEENHAQVQPSDHLDHHRVHAQVIQDHVNGIKAVPHNPDLLSDQPVVYQTHAIRGIRRPDHEQ